MNRAAVLGELYKFRYNGLMQRYFNSQHQYSRPAGTTKGYYQHPQLGTLEICGKDGYITAISFTDDQQPLSTEVPDYIAAAINQLAEYFNSKRTSFDLPLLVEGTEFEIKVWELLLQIPFGQTYSYKELAEKLGSTTYTRPVGTANGKNKIFIVIPCHRVIASDGSLAGYAGEIWRKEILLTHEGYSYQSKHQPTQQLSLFG
jgi:methylated-DNA-[protein]-cysteine S-methyltransferase